ncbi:MAG TPA: type II CAAX endopeptidase family protein [Sedimentibacter sp.]|nr:type II CAAX endopeptidase family protein [Sedimentibacter sp.]HOH68974.1 type II CAAX endopeptidase family protein [Sedimentibacter sp.]HPW99692.1 type II CAAX endopeptidase family protein [Sedimentibacter sp.]
MKKEIRNSAKKIIITCILIFACLSMYLIETYVKPAYIFKSVYKILLFAGLPLCYSLIDKNFKFKEYFIINDKRQIFIAAVLGISVYFVILIGYFIIKGFIDLDNITIQLNNNLNVNKENFIFVALYISFVNSMLEEMFFRGFGFLTLGKHSSYKYSILTSALAFSIYHVSILANWFHIVIYIVFILGLFFTGLFFNWMNLKNNNLYNSWIVHVSANLSINTIGFIMYGMI